MYVFTLRHRADELPRACAPTSEAIHLLEGTVLCDLSIAERIALRCVGTAVAARSYTPQRRTLHQMCRCGLKAKAGTADGLLRFASQVWSDLNVLHCGHESGSTQAKWKASGSDAGNLVEWEGKGRRRATRSPHEEGSLPLSLSVDLSPSQRLQVPPFLKCLHPTIAICGFFIWLHTLHMWTAMPNLDILGHRALSETNGHMKHDDPQKPMKSEIVMNAFLRVESLEVCRVLLTWTRPCISFLKCQCATNRSIMASEIHPPTCSPRMPSFGIAKMKFGSDTIMSAVFCGFIM